MIFGDELFQCLLGIMDLLFRRGGCWIDHRGIQHFSGGIHNGQFTAGTESRIPAQDHLACDWRLHQKLGQVFAEDCDSSILRLLRQNVADLTLDGRGDETTVAVSNDLF